ncbi:MAG: chloride channel protein, partial [bacterium]|nr:chloride channel protein [bacterium]
SVMATAVSRAFFGNYPIFKVPLYSLVSIWEIPFYMILGILTGLIGLAFIESVYSSERFWDRLKIPEFLKTPIGGAMLGLLIIICPHVFGGGYESIEMVLRGEFIWHTLLLLIVFKLLATSLTLGSGGSGGVFAPALFLGAVSGGAFGHLINFVFPGMAANSGAYAMVGMGAVVAATTHAPITAILILFEITNDYKIILPIMISCTIATVLARRLKQDSIYTQKLTLRGISLNQGREEIIMKSFLVGDLMHSKVSKIKECTRLKQIIKIFMESQEPYYYVVNDQNRLLGTLSTHLVKSVLSATESLNQLVIAKDLSHPIEEFVVPETNLADCMNRFERVESEHLPVVDNIQSMRLIGMVSKKEIIKLYNREILRKDIIGVKYVRDLGSEKMRNLVQLPSDFKVDFIRVPDSFIGKSIKQLDIRAQYNITILAVKKKLSDIGPSNEMPNPDRIFQADDILVAAGKEKELEKLRKLLGKN